MITNFNVAEAAEHLRISEVELRRRLKSGELAHVRIGRRIVIRSQDVEAFCQANAIPARRAR